MPRILGHDLIAFILAGLAFYMIGVMIYVILFGEYWREIASISMEFAPAPWKMGLGFILPFISTAGLAFLYDKAGTRGLADHVVIAVIAAIAFSVMAMAYGYAYGPTYNIRMLSLDSLHMVLGFAAAGAVLSWRKD